MRSVTVAPPHDPPRAGSDAVEAGPPQHVLSAFGVRDVTPRPRRHLPGPAWVCGTTLLRPVADTVLAAWSAATLEELASSGGVDDVRIARPIRASDGRRVVAGWSACHDLPGTVEARHDDVVAASLRLHRATARLERPRIVDDRDDLLVRADRAAAGERPADLDPETGGTLFGELARRRTAPDPGLRPQLVHGDLFGTVVFAADAPPAVLDVVPFWRPPEWAAAVVVVDALAWGGADPGLLSRWSHLTDWPQMLLHGLLFRLAVHAQHPACTRDSLRGLEHVSQLVVGVL